MTQAPPNPAAWYDPHKLIIMVDPAVLRKLPVEFASYIPRWLGRPSLILVAPPAAAERHVYYYDCTGTAGQWTVRQGVRVIYRTDAAGARAFLADEHPVAPPDLTLSGWWQLTPEEGTPPGANFGRNEGRNDPAGAPLRRIIAHPLPGVARPGPRDPSRHNPVHPLPPEPYPIHATFDSPLMGGHLRLPVAAWQEARAHLPLQDADLEALRTDLAADKLRVYSCWPLPYINPEPPLGSLDYEAYVRREPWGRCILRWKRDQAGDGIWYDLVVLYCEVRRRQPYRDIYAIVPAASGDMPVARAEDWAGIPVTWGRNSWDNHLARHWRIARFWPAFAETVAQPSAFALDTTERPTEERDWIGIRYVFTPPLTVSRRLFSGEAQADRYMHVRLNYEQKGNLCLAWVITAFVNDEPVSIGEEGVIWRQIATS